MFARIEVAMRPEFADPAAQRLLRRIELAHPDLRRKIRWARSLDVYWLDLPLNREEAIGAITEVFWDRVLQWLITGNLIPSAAGKFGSLQDLMEAAPIRPGKFWALERRFRPGVTDNVARTALEAFEIVAGKKLPAGRTASGSLVLFEGPELSEDLLAPIARDVLCNELIETWTMIGEQELCKSDRFHQERIKRDIPVVSMRPSDRVETVNLNGLSDADLEAMSRRKLWALSGAEMRAIRDHYSSPAERQRRATIGLADPTDVEMEVLAQTWSEHCKHKIFGARFKYRENLASAGDTGVAAGGKGGIEPGSDSGVKPATRIPSEVDSLFKTTIAGTTEKLPKPWLLSVFEDNAGIVALDDEDAFCIKVETHNSPSALDPYGGALTGIVGVNRDILGCGLGAKPVLNTDVFCVAPVDYAEELPERILHPRRILDGVRRGVEDGGNKSGIPTINGALCFDERFLGKPLVYCGTGGIMPRVSAGRHCETKEIMAGDLICMVGGRVGKDGIHGATFSSLPMDELSPVTAVQLGDPLTQKRMADFLLEARDAGMYRAITDNGAGGLSSSVGELAQLAGGARIDVSKAKTKYPGLKPYELVVSESQERMTVAVPPATLKEFLALAERRGVEVSELGEFAPTGAFDIFAGDKQVASIDLNFLHKGVPRLEIPAEWKGVSAKGAARPAQESFERDGAKILLELLGRPNIASKEWLIRQYDHEVQGMSVIKPLHTASPGTPSAWSGPNDAGVIKPKPSSPVGIAVGCGINPKLSDVDPFLMAQSAVDEAVRNVICVGADFGRADSFLALVDNFCWPDPVNDPSKAGALVRACFGLREAALALDAPLVSGKDSMKNDFKGRRGDRDVVISVPPTLLVTAVAKMRDVQYARTADFKTRGDAIYLIGGRRLGLLGSELHAMRAEAVRLAGSPGGYAVLPQEKARIRSGTPDWSEASRTYRWLGGTSGKTHAKLRSLHDVSDGGVLVAVAECMLARNLGAAIELAGEDDLDPWELSFGEGFHTFVATTGDAESAAVEAEWTALGVPFRKLGAVSGGDRLEVRCRGKSWSVDTKSLRTMWRKEGYWE